MAQRSRKSIYTTRQSFMWVFNKIVNLVKYLYTNVLSSSFYNPIFYVVVQYKVNLCYTNFGAFV